LSTTLAKRPAEEPHPQRVGSWTSGTSSKSRITPYVDIATPSIDDLTSGARHHPNAQRRSGRGMCPSSGREWMRRRRRVGGCARSVRGLCWRRSPGGGRAALSSVRSVWSSTAEWVPAAAPRRVVSTTGAGEAATAGLLSGLAQGTGIRWATRLAARFAAANLEGKRPSAEEASRWAAELTAAGLD
jgi:sugar/nucleoside kinase (ribokinase family)